jgi:hypothetical protein
MLSERKSDPYYLTATPNTRRKRRLRRQKTTLSRHNSGNESASNGGHFLQMLMNTKSAVQGIGYNVRNFLFDETNPVDIDHTLNSRVWLLGREKHTSDEFQTAWNRIMRLTYKKRWPESILNPLSGISYDSDIGWGCTIRSCQMLMANVLIRMGVSQGRIETYFRDEESSLLSVHNFVNSQTSIPAGQWFGPSSVSTSLKRIIDSDEGRALELGLVLSVDGHVQLVEILDQSRPRPESPSIGCSSSPSSPAPDWGSPRANSWELCNPSEGVALSSSLNSSCMGPSPRCHAESSVNQEFWVIDEDDHHDGDSDESLVEVLDVRSSTMWARPVLVVVAMRLSPESDLSKPQLCALLSYMTIPSFVGLVGGPDRRCHYIAGLLEESVSEVDESENQCYEYTLLSVDPHMVQDSAVMCMKNSTNPSRISPSYLCPSVAIGFLLRSQSDLEELERQLATARHGFIEISSKPFPSSTSSPVVVLE